MGGSHGDRYSAWYLGYTLICPELGDGVQTGIAGGLYSRDHATCVLVRQWSYIEWRIAGFGCTEVE